MKHFDREKIQGKTLILVAPLDWGLGHATRCIPVIKELLKQGAEVLLAAEGLQAALLSAEFPALTILPLEGYKIKYGSSRTGLAWNILRQGPGLLKSINREKQWLEDTIKKYPVSGVISDNRFGLHTRKLPCVFLTHQLQIKSPAGKLMDALLRQWNYQHINKFFECWVPDNDAVHHNLAGDLSHPGKLPVVPVKYLGPLSRFETTTEIHCGNRIVILLSGPEPQRSLLENKLINQMIELKEEIVMVRGLPGEARMIPSTRNLNFYNHLPAGELHELLLSASFVICRSGYSTVMDLIRFRKKSILIPTPGQTEQEYIAGFLQSKQFAFCVEQEHFSLAGAIADARRFNYQLANFNSQDNLAGAVKDFLQVAAT
jgi:uncharacterized protein (TIGR00661 family)